jgi:hypothetical protein
MTAVTREMNRGGGNPAAFILMAALLFAAALWTLLAVAENRQQQQSGAVATAVVVAEAPMADVSYDYLMSLLVQDGIPVPVEDRDHAILKHGKEAADIRRACEDNGVWRLYQFRHNPFKYAAMCILPDGRIGVRILEIVGSNEARRLMERTSFVPGDGSLYRAVEYVSAKAVEVFEPLSTLFHALP